MTSCLRHTYLSDWLDINRYGMNCKQLNNIQLADVYWYEPRNDVSVNDGPHTRWCRHKIIIQYYNTYRCADKSLARPGRKQATAIKLLSFASHSKKFRRMSVQPGLRGSNDFRVRRKTTNFQFFSIESD